MQKEIKINCKGTAEVDIKELQNFQGNLKELKKPEFDKLKNSILEYGFRFPVFTWNNNLIDGNTRIFVINKLIKDGYILNEKIPIIEIPAKDEKEAKKLLLLFNSRYAKMDMEGLSEFSQGIEKDFFDKLDFAEFDIDKFKDSFFEDPTPPEKKSKELICPECGYNFNEKG
jgi:hypothetical protein